LSKNVKIKIYKRVILHVVLYECETLFLTLRQEHGLKVFENRVLRKVVGPKRDEGTGGWRKLHDEKQWAGHIACIGEKRNACRILVGKPEGKRTPGRLGIGGR
jgi:hypothetical protein